MLSRFTANTTATYIYSIPHIARTLLEEPLSHASLDTASNLTDLVSYQVGSVVSRVLTKGPSGSVTAFAFDEGQDLSEHATPFDALLQVIEGTATITIAGKPHRVKGGQIIRLPANEPHAVAAEERFKMLLMMLRRRST